MSRRKRCSPFWFRTVWLLTISLGVSVAFQATPPILAAEASEIDAALSELTQIDYDKVPLGEVVAQLRQDWNVDLMIDRVALEDYGIPDDAPVSIHLESVSRRAALHLMLRPLSLTWHVRDDAIWISTPEAVESALSISVYDVADFANEVSQAELINAIQSSVAPESWAAVGGPGAITSFADTLVVTQTSINQNQIDRFIDTFQRVRNASADEVRPVSFGFDDRSRDRIRNELQQSVSANANDQPLHAVLESMGKSRGIPIVLDRNAFEDYGIDASHKVSLQATEVPLRSVLYRLLTPMGLTWSIENEVLNITTVDAAESNLEVRFYPVVGLAREPHGVDRLSQVLLNTIAPDSWDVVGGPATLATFSDPATLLVAQTLTNHEAIERLLGDLRDIAARREQQVADGVPQFKLQAYSLAWGTPNPYPVDDLIALIQEVVGNEAWSDEQALMRGVGNSLIVRNSRDVHSQIQSLLKEMGLWYPIPSVSNGGKQNQGGGFQGGGGGGGFF